MELNSPKRNRIKSLDGLKFFAFIAVFLHHESFPGVSDKLIGDRAVEVFFIISGLLIAHNYSKKHLDYTWKESCVSAQRVYKKFAVIHFLLFVLFAVFISGIQFSTDGLLTAVVNLMLMQSWSHNIDVFFSFNGVSWYLSSLLFCYFMIPPLMQLAKTKKRAAVSLAAFVFLRYAVEYIAKTRPETFFVINTYVFPPIRCLEFGMGIFTYVLAYDRIKSFLDIRSGIKVSVAMSLLEMLCLAVYIYAIFNLKLWLTANYIMLTVPVVFVVALQRGVIGQFLGNRFFAQTGKIQMELYMFHVFVILFVEKYSVFNGIGRNTEIILTFLATIAIAVAYKIISSFIVSRLVCFDRKK